MSIRAVFNKPSADGLIKKGVAYDVNYNTSRTHLIELSARGRGCLLYPRHLYDAAFYRGEVTIFK